MDEKTMRLEYSSALTNLIDVNPSFDMATLRIAYTGKNRNYSFISKEAFERAVPSMFGCPVVANYLRDDDEIGAHDAEFLTRENGDIDYVNLTQPVGFVPPGAQWCWEVVEDNQEIHQYLTTEVLLWKRQEAYTKIKANGITKQSMEISVIDGQMQDDYYQINDFYFTAFCLLGTAEPCFESAALCTFEHMDMFKAQMSEMLEEFKLAFAADERFQIKEGDKRNMDKFNELLEQYNVSAEDITFDVEGLSDDELVSAFATAFAQEPKDDEEELVDEDKAAEEDDADEEDEAEEDEPAEDESAEDELTDEEKFVLNHQLSDALRTAVRDAGEVAGEYGTYPRYYMVDFDAELSEVYFEDATDFILYGASYQLDGDNVIVDFESAKRKKFAIVDYDNGTEIFSMQEYVASFVEACAAQCATEYAALEEKYNAVVAAELQRGADALFESFEEKLAGDPEFEALKHTQFDNLEDLETKLYAMVGRKQFKFNISNKNILPKSPKAPVVVAPKTQGGPYGDLFNFIGK